MLRFTNISEYSNQQVAGLLGYIPTFLDENDPRSAREQFNENYIGGWSPFEGFTMNPKTKALAYPGDPSYYPVAKATLHGTEEIYMYHHAWVAIIQADGTYEVCRMD